MKALVIYDSFFGNTGQIAKSIGNSFHPSEDVRVCRVDEVNLNHLTGMDLLIIGSPTRGFSPTPAITNFIKKIPANGLKEVRVAAFDTRFSLGSINSSTLRFMVKTGGYAARSISNRLIKKGGYLIMPPEGFFVDGTEGPLQEGEIYRAKAWVKILVKCTYTSINTN